MISQIINTISQILHLSPLSTQIGLICLASQLILTILFDKRSNILPLGPWSSLSAFTAHQVVAFPSMILLSYYGWKEWDFNYTERSSYDASSSYDKLFGITTSNNTIVNDIPLAYGTGAILLWDIPLGIFAPSLRDGIMLLHHIGMFGVAAVMSGMFSQGRLIGYYYVPFYFGVIETSSVFLSVVDQFHPKRKDWYEWLNCSDGGSGSTTTSLMKIVHQLNEMCRTLFAISFILLRGIYFPYTSFCHCIPDIWRAYEKRPEEVPLWTGYFLMASLVLFSCLQSYWGILVARQIKKALSGDDTKKKK